MDSREKLKKLEAELEEIKALKTQNLNTVPPPIDPNEALTRSIYINSLLREAGWDPFGVNVAEYPVNGMPTADGKNNGADFVDYVLWADDVPYFLHQLVNVLQLNIPYFEHSAVLLKYPDSYSRTTCLFKLAP